MTDSFSIFPAELVADVLSQLDLAGLIVASGVSKRFRTIISDPSLNPWRRPIMRNLLSNGYEPALSHLSVRTTVPRRNWIPVMTMADASFLLHEATWPNLSEADWEECFNRRFLPGWRKIKRESIRWRAAFSMTLQRVVHRTMTICSVEEAWTKYIVLNRNGSANQMDTSTRGLDPFAVFNEMRLQNNLTHLEMHVRLVVSFTDARVLAFGTLNRPRSHFTVNPNARNLLHPPGIEKSNVAPDSTGDLSTNTEYQPSPVYSSSYDKLVYPQPAHLHRLYPFYTPGGADRRWLKEEEEGLKWVGPLMLIAQYGSPANWPPTLEGGDSDTDDYRFATARRLQYCSFTWKDLWVIAPWLREGVTVEIDGPGLGTRI